MTQIALFDIEVDFTPYKVELHSNSANVWVVKTRRNGDTYMQQLKNGSGTYRRVIRHLKKVSQSGSLAAEQISRCSVI